RAYVSGRSTSWAAATSTGCPTRPATCRRAARHASCVEIAAGDRGASARETYARCMSGLEQMGVGVVAPRDMALDRELRRWVPDDGSVFCTDRKSVGQGGRGAG